MKLASPTLTPALLHLGKMMVVMTGALPPGTTGHSQAELCREGAHPHMYPQLSHVYHTQKVRPVDRSTNMALSSAHTIVLHHSPLLPLTIHSLPFGPLNSILPRCPLRVRRRVRMSCNAA